MEKKLQILIVDDDKIDRKSLQRFLQSSNLEVETHEAGYINDAVKKIISFEYDCILLDNNLPDGTGIELLNALPSAEKNMTPLIFLTGSGDEMIAVQALKSGASDYIPKERLSSEALESSILKSIKISDLEKRSRAAEEILKERENEFRTILASVPDIIIKLDREQNISFVNEAVNFLGFDPDLISGKNIKDLVSDTTNDYQLEQLTTKRIGPRGTENLEISMNVYKNSMIYGSTKSIQVLIDAKGLWDVADEKVLDKDCKKKFLGTLLVAKNLTNQKRIENELRESQKKLEESVLSLEKLSNQDGLTGIPNRYCFDEFFSREVKRAKRDKSPISLIMIDIDFFKQYNDNYGHQAGDDCLIKVAKTLNASLKRPSDMAARYGGEEFVVVLPGSNEEGAIAFAENVRQMIESLEIEHRGSNIHKHVTISLGMCTACPGENNDPELIIKNADEALYKAKDEGRNRIANDNLLA